MDTTHTREGEAVLQFQERFRDAARNAVLEALDTVTQNLIGPERSGWKDEELGRLLPHIDRHAAAVLLRLAAEVNRRAIEDTIDFRVSDCGSVYLLTPRNDKAREHITEHVGQEAQWFGPALAVEHRYITDLVMRLRDAGFNVSTA